MLEFVEALKSTDDFFRDCKSYGYNLEYPGFQFSRGRKNYDRTVRRLRELNLPNPMLFKYTQLTIGELKKLITDLMCKIFGEEYRERIEELNKLIVLGNIPKYFDSIIEQTEVNDSFYPINIFISNRMYSIQGASTGHEYIHALLSPYSTNRYNEKLNNYHYKELLSIIVEYILCYELSLLFKEDMVEEKHNVIRADFNKALVVELDQCEKLAIRLKKEKREQEEAKRFDSCVEFKRHHTFGYILSDIYGVYLANIYKDDKKALIQLIKGIIDDDKCVNDLLAYYGIDLLNTDIVQRYNSHLDQVLSYKL